MIALLFAGQGNEPPRAGIELAQRSRAAHRLMERASEAAQVDLARLLVRGGRVLYRTEVLQPAITAVALGVWAVLDEAGVAPDYVAGHSLGEIAAWSAAGCIAPEAAVDVAGLRGRLMAREADRAGGGMLAVDSEHAMRAAVALGAQLAAHNAEDEWVVTGGADILARAAERVGGIRLRVAGPWHSSEMAAAARELSRALSELPALPARARIVCNRTGEVADAAAMPELLAGQLTRPIEWVRTMRTLAGAGVDTLVTVGPGRVLRSLARKTLGSTVTVLATESWDDLQRTREALA